MDLVVDPPPKYLERLPFPAGWQGVCSFLTTGDILRLSATCHSCLEIASANVRDLTICEGGPTSVSQQVLSRCTRVARLRLVGLDSSSDCWKIHGLAQLAPHSFQSLVAFDLSGNMMGDTGLAVLLPCLELAHSLQILILDSNALGNSGAHVLRRGLERGLLSRLKVLSLAFNAMGSMGAWELAQALRGGCCSELEIMNLDGNILGPAGTAELAQAFRQGACSALRQLYLRNNNVQNGLRDLLAAFSSGACSRLEVLYLDSNMMGAMGARLLANALRHGAISELQVLSLNATFMGEGARELFGAFRHGACKQLQQLYLKNVYLEENGISDLQSSAVLGNLQVLNLDFNRIGPQGLAVLAEALRSGICHSLQELHMSNMALNEESFGVLAEALRTNACGALQLLSLDSNGLGVPGARLLSDLISSWQAPQLSHLSLHNNQLTDRGIELLAEAFKTGTCPGLQSLRLDSNLIGEAGARALAGAFQVGAFPSLRELTLRNNQLHNMGVCQLLVSAKQSELEVLQLDGNRVNDEGMLALADLFNQGCYGKLRELHLKHNFFRNSMTPLVLMEAFCGSARRNGVRPEVLSLGVEDNLLTTGASSSGRRRYSWG